MPVCWRTGTRSGPGRAAGDRPHRGRRGSEEPETQQRPPGRRHGDGHDRRRGGEDEQRVERAGPVRAELHRERALAGHGVARDVAQVVGDQDRAGQRTDADRGEQRRPLPGLGLHVRRADDRDEAEEHEHHDLAQAEVAVRLRAAGVEPGRHHADRTDRDQPPGGRRRQHQPGDRRDAEGEERRPLHRARLGHPRPDQPHRPDPVGVGAADAVGVVVGVVDRRPAARGSRPGRAAPSRARPRRRTPRRRCRRGRATRPRAACAAARLPATARGSSRAAIQHAGSAGLLSARETDRDDARGRRVGRAVAGRRRRRTGGRRDVRVVGRAQARRAVPRGGPGVGRGHGAPARWRRALAAGPAGVVRRRAAGGRPVADRGARADAARGARLGRGGHGGPRPRLRLAGADPAAPDARGRRPRPRRCGRSARSWSVADRSTPDCASGRPRSGVSVVATYGSAETAGGCVYDGVGLDGVGLAVDGEGRLRIAGPDALRRVRRRPGAHGGRCWSTGGS